MEPVGGCPKKKKKVTCGSIKCRGECIKKGSLHGEQQCPFGAVPRTKKEK